MRVLTFTSLYPNEFAPRHGIFVQSRMAYFDLIPGTARQVIAPLQDMPLLGRLPGSRFYGARRIAVREIQGDIPVWHPRYVTLPGTRLINPAAAMARAGARILPQAYPDGVDFDLVDGHYLYPDGVAAHRLARRHDKPLILTARGSDVNFWMTRPGPRREILAALVYARRVICVSQALKDRLIAYGVAADKILVILNGVDRARFNADATPGPNPGYLLSIGNLVPLKGHDIILRALAHMPGERLVLIGAGECAESLRSLARELGVTERVTFLPHVPQADLPGYYAGARATLLLSSMEGMPNVVLESLACGIPVIATAVGGIPEVVTEDNGLLLPARTPEALVDALNQTRDRDWDRTRIARDMAWLDWRDTAQNVHRCFAETL